MKSVLLYANRDAGLDSRLHAALDAARLCDGHLTCLQVIPYDAFIMGDPFGGVYALPTVIEQVQRTAAEHRAEIEERLRGEGVGWDWLRFDGAPAQLIVDRSRLSDLIVLSLPGGESGAEAPREHGAPTAPSGGWRSPMLVADVLVHARAPVLAVPRAGGGFDGAGGALVAWDGSLEASHALRLTLPMLNHASEVNVVTVAEGHSEFPATDACHYLARHGIEPELHEWPREGRSTAAALLDAATSLGAAYVVMGAYGHTRLREAILGGATRDMLHQSPLPLLLAH